MHVDYMHGSWIFKLTACTHVMENPDKNPVVTFTSERKWREVPKTSKKGRPTTCLKRTTKTPNQLANSLKLLVSLAAENLHNGSIWGWSCRSTCRRRRSLPCVSKCLYNILYVYFNSNCNRRQIIWGIKYGHTKSYGENTDHKWWTKWGPSGKKTHQDYALCQLLSEMPE